MSPLAALFAGFLLLACVWPTLLSSSPAILPLVAGASLTFHLRAGWNSTSLALEASEYFADDAHAYFEFLTQLSAHARDLTSERAEYEKALEVASQLLGTNSSSLAVLRSNLLLRTASPAIETYRAMRQNRIAEAVAAIPYSDANAEEKKDAAEAKWSECTTLVAVNGQLYCSIDEAIAYIQTLAVDDEIEQQEAAYEFDHVHPHCSSAPLNMIVYTDPFAMSEFGYINSRIGMLNQPTPRVRFILRPVAKLVSNAPLYVQGFGVELAIKNMEYKVVDDSKIEVDPNAVTIDLPEEMRDSVVLDSTKDLSGFDFDVLLQRRPELANELNELKSALSSSASSGSKSATKDGGDEKKLAVWDMKDLGFQVCQRALASSVPLEALRDLSQNFPMYAQALTRTRVNATIKAALERNVGGNQHGLALPPAGTNLMEINGQMIHLAAGEEAIDIYAILALLKTESMTIDALAQLDLPTTSNLSQTLMQVSMASKAEAEAVSGHQHGGGGSSAPAFLLDMSVRAPSTRRILTWLNDIERDARYKSWPASLQELLVPTWPNQLKYVRKNIVTAILIADPSTRRGLEYLTQAKFFVEANAPIRIGITFWISPAAPAAATNNKQMRAWNSDILPKNEGSVWYDVAGEEVYATETSGSSAYASLQATVAKVFYHLQSLDAKHKQQGSGLEFLQRLFDAMPANSKPSDAVTMDAIKTAYGAALKAKLPGIKSPEKLKAVLANVEYDELVQLNIDFAAERGLAPDSATALALAGQAPFFIVNGALHRPTSPAQSFRELMMQTLPPEQYKLTLATYHGTIDDRTKDIFHVLQTKPNVYARVHPAVQTSMREMKLLQKMPSYGEFVSLTYHTSPEPASEAPPALTFWLVADWTTLRGLDLTYSLLEYLAKGDGPDRIARVAFAFHTGKAPQDADKDLRTAMTIARELLQEEDLNGNGQWRFDLARQLVMLVRYCHGLSDRAERLKQALRIFLASNARLAESVSPKLSESYFPPPGYTNQILVGYLEQQGFLSASSSNVLVLNGRVLDFDAPTFDGAAAADGNFLSDLRLLATYTMNNFGLRDILQHIANEKDLTARQASDAILRASVALLKRSLATGGAGAQQTRGGAASTTFPSYDATNTLGMVRIANPTSLLQVRLALDPLSKAAQKVLPIVIALREMFAPDITVWLTPKSGITEFPLKRFYRYALQPARTLQFEESGALKPFVGTRFHQIQTQHILSTVVFTPESWSIALAAAKYDLDNLNLAEMPADATVKVEYALKNLLIFGQCFESNAAGARVEPPAGLQLMIGSAAQPFLTDTLVMANLGYFQLKSNPGEWTLRIADERHAEIYEIKQASSQPGKKGTRQLFVRSFNEGFMTLDVARRPGQESAVLLDPVALERQRREKNKAAAKKAKSGGGLLSSLFGGGDDSTKQVAGRNTNRTGETIHVFSLASGHLYERFLKIMMLSVLESTPNNPIKFWFLANFASPQFMEFVPQMAKHYGFEAEFVTYKWPVWLRRQEEKQRIIWGMKILFLDVLFPLAVPRIVYIDADQVVRGDLAELWALDLENNAPYAYTPFCDSNPDTEGFRFWKSGYWKEHLRGKPYHISALYVVDLERFRAMRAGDSLRGIYDQLSADPGSLANLDQDLPNYAQHMVPIHSLPQEWLWCQTWCSMESLPDAKTIDLCNNPLTKTPKLDVARQLLPEWTTLDARAKALEPIFAARNAHTTAAHATAAASAQPVTPHDEL